MSFEDLPRKPAGIVLGENLDLLSVSELEHRVLALEQEIQRVKAAIHFFMCAPGEVEWAAAAYVRLARMPIND